jgi:hypothetical protein
MVSEKNPFKFNHYVLKDKDSSTLEVTVDKKRKDLWISYDTEYSDCVTLSFKQAKKLFTILSKLNLGGNK